MKRRVNGRIYGRNRRILTDRPAVPRPPSAVPRPPSAVPRRPSAVPRPPSAVRRPSSVVRPKKMKNKGRREASEDEGGYERAVLGSSHFVWTLPCSNPRHRVRVTTMSSRGGASKQKSRLDRSLKA